ncbi:aminotransferase class IV family protein [Streptomyces sp. NPDC059679]|uniref:aminotransferase class IV family protein n=1 Tax=Streptomyces sp. NPDC059679 TaxID=3346903 RepID=UPI003676ABDD
MAELNGVPVALNDLKALALTNYGHFTSIRVEDQHVRGLSLHMDRLVRDCRALFNAELDPQRIRDFTRKAVGDKPGSFVVRVTVFDPALEMGHPGVSAEPHILVTTRAAAGTPLPPMRVKSLSYRRDLPAVKHVGLFGQIKMRRDAQLAGFDDVLFTEGSGLISEGGTWNCGFFDGERVIWPQADVLPGVTMRLLQQAHERTITAPVTLDDLPRMEAAFATNAGIGVRAITAVDATELATEHPIIETLRQAYADVPREKL